MLVHDVRFEHLREALGLGTGTPRLSWQVADAPAGWVQTGYAVEVRHLDGAAVGPSVHRVDSAEQILAPWPATALPSRGRAEVRLRVHGRCPSGGDAATASPWSDPVAVEAGLLESADWTARLVRPEPDAAGPTPRPAMLLRTEILLREQPVRARWYVTAEGLYRAEINGQRVGDDELAPGWTSYHQRLRYRTYDVTALLGPARTRRRVAGRRLVPRPRRVRRRRPRPLRPAHRPSAQLEVHYRDGSVEGSAPMTPGWSTRSPITATGLYEGETFDARAVRPTGRQPVTASPTGAP